MVYKHTFLCQWHGFPCNAYQIPPKSTRGLCPLHAFGRWHLRLVWLSQRDCAAKPRVGASRLTWEGGRLLQRPQRGCGPDAPDWPQPPSGVLTIWQPLPRVALEAQPWAGGQNPDGIQETKCAGRKGVDLFAVDACRGQRGLAHFRLRESYDRRAETLRAIRRPQCDAMASRTAAALRGFARASFGKQVSQKTGKIPRGGIMDWKRLVNEGRPAKAPEGWRSPGHFARYGSRNVSRGHQNCGGPTPVFAGQARKTGRICASDLAGTRQRNFNHEIHGIHEKETVNYSRISGISWLTRRSARFLSRLFRVS